MKEFLDSNKPDAPNPLSSSGTPDQKYRNAAGDFNVRNSYGPRKEKSRKDLDQPALDQGPLAISENEEDDSTKRYFGDFSVEAKRNVKDLLKNHPMFDGKNMRLNRIQNNTREVMPNDPTKTVENGGHIVYNNLPQSSQTKY